MADKKVKKAKKTKVVKQKQTQRQTVNVNINTADKRTKRTRKTTTTTNRTITPRISGIPQSTNVVVHNNIPELQNLIQSMMPQHYNTEPPKPPAAQASNPVVSPTVGLTARPQGLISNKPNNLLKMRIPNELTAPINIQPKYHPEKLPPEYYTPPSTTPSLLGENNVNSLGQNMERRRKEEASIVKIEKFLEKAVRARKAKKDAEEKRPVKQFEKFLDGIDETRKENLKAKTIAEKKKSRDQIYQQVIQDAIRTDIGKPKKEHQKNISKAIKDTAKIGDVYFGDTAEKEGKRPLTTKGKFNRQVVNIGRPKKNKETAT